MGEKRDNAMKILKIAIPLLIVAVFFLLLNVIKNKVELEDNTLKISGVFYNANIDISEIDNVTSETGFSYGRRTFGVGGGKTLTGKFNNNALGDYDCCANPKIDRVIIVKTNDKTYVFNLEDEKTTEQFFESLQKQLS